MNKKTGGPVTQAGKKRSSQNATKHGGTATRLVDEAERQRFGSLLQDLTKHYPSANPLVSLQLERIARLIIQLERIQTIIDAKFEISRTTPFILEKLMQDLEMDPHQQAIAIKSLFGFHTIDAFVNEERFHVANELVGLVCAPPTTQKEFLERSPLFCNYLFTQANEKEVGIKEYIDTYIPSREKSPGIGLILKGLPTSNGKGQSMEDAILEVDMPRLNRAAEWCIGEFSRITLTAHKLGEFRKLMPVKEQAITPDLDELDRLMRYQTTLQRQLSTAMGELLVLTKSEP